MRHLINHRKEQKTLKLAKKLQEEADKEWEKEFNKRREQELSDEAIAKALQAQLEQEERQQSSPATSPVQNNTPPPLPNKPRGYHPVNNETRHSSVSPPLTPLYRLPNSSASSPTPPSNSEQPSLPPRQPKKNLYQPEVQYRLQSPTPSPSTVFYQDVPGLKPLSGLDPKSSIEPIYKPKRSSPPPAINIKSPVLSIPSNLPTENSMSMPVPAISPPPQQQQVSNSFYASRPQQLPHHHSDPSPLTQQHQQQHIYPNNSTSPPPGVTLPLNVNTIIQNSSSPTHSSQPSLHHYPSSPPSNAPFYLRPAIHESVLSLNNMHIQPMQQQPIQPMQQQPIQPIQQQPIQQQQMNSNNPYLANRMMSTQQIPLKQAYSDSVLSLKPDENETNDYKKDDSNVNNGNDTTRGHVRDRLVNRPPTPMESTTIEHAQFSDEESDVDYSDMIYQRKESDCSVKSVQNKTTAEQNGYTEENESEDDEDDDNWKDTAIDPFADVFDLQESHDPKATTATMISAGNSADEKKPTVEILDPTLLSRKATKISTEKENIVKAISGGPRIYEEKESNEIEVRSPSYHSIPAQTLNMQPVALPPKPLVEIDLLAQEQLPVLPTNILRASKPPTMSPNNPYNKSQHVQKQHPIPATDYGYFKDEEKSPFEGKSLPNLPVASSDEDRHITVSSINPGQRVWIRIKPRDTGKALAERIHYVASYQTRRVTKITTTSGRNVPIDNTPLFDNWDEILSFKNGEPWRVEWVPIENPYVDLISEGRGLIQKLKANFKGSSSLNDE